MTYGQAFSGIEAGKRLSNRKQDKLGKVFRLW